MYWIFGTFDTVTQAELRVDESGWIRPLSGSEPVQTWKIFRRMTAGCYGYVLQRRLHGHNSQVDPSCGCQCYGLFKRGRKSRGKHEEGTVPHRLFDDHFDFLIATLSLWNTNCAEKILKIKICKSDLMSCVYTSWNQVLNKIFFWQSINQNLWSSYLSPTG